MTHVPLAARPLAGLVPGDHVCCSFGSDAEQQAIVGQHAREAIHRGARFVYFADRSDETTVCAFLEEAGIDSAGGLRSGQIRITRWFVPDGELDVEAMIASFEEFKAETLHDGYSALVAASEMSWSIDREDEAHRVVQYELEVNRAFKAPDVIGLCLYDRRLFAPAMLTLLQSVHGCRVSTHEHITSVTRGRLTVTEEADLVVTLSGELDIDAAPYLAARFAVRPPDDDVVVDLAALEFVDIAGCRLLVEAAERLGGGHRMVLLDPGPVLQKIFNVCGWRDHPRLVLA